MFQSNETPLNNSSSAQIAVDKYCTNQLLAMAGIPVPKATILTKHDFIKNRLNERIAGLKFPLVVKPNDGSLGLDVLCNIRDVAELTKHLERLFKAYDTLIIEAFHARLNSYRILVFQGKVIGVVQRHPARVIGDGINTLRQLIELTNKERKIINDALGLIQIDEEGRIKLEELGITPEYIPEPGECVVLCYTSNASRGGSFESLGQQICKENRRLMRRIAQCLDLVLTGIDVECADINRPITPSNGVVLEVNHRPSIRIHEIPMSGQPERVTLKIMRSFIYRHPLAYLHALYSNKKTSFYFRAALLTIATSLVLCIVHK